ncbi:MAG: methylamine utilization protein MauE [Acidimicrobiia bacterium]|nr:methylamine utilization protein MauE [Acidimicrobiia bacterium]
MRVVGLVLATTLAAVFATAAVTKLADRPATARLFRALGLRRTYPLALAVPVVEGAVAVGLLTVPAAGAVAAIALLAAFSAFLADRLRRGFDTPCACFGSASARPLGPRHLVRNAMLAALAAGVVVMAGAQPAPARFVAVGAAFTLVAAVVALVRSKRPQTRRAGGSRKSIV